ncbi:MAG: peptidoglycan DD-metalloendopeptidase family protein [Candidatus Dormibacteria bacterium]
MPMNFPRLLFARAILGSTALMASTGVLVALAANPPAPPPPKPGPTASPTTVNNCVVDPLMSADPQIKALMDHCQADLAAINGDKSKLQDSIAMAQGSAASLEQMLQQTRDAIVASEKRQLEIKRQIHDLEVRQAETTRQIDITRARLARRRAEYAAFLRRNYKFQPQLWASLFESSGISEFLGRATALVQVKAFGNEMLASIKLEENRLEQQRTKLAEDHQAVVKQQADLVKAQEQLALDEGRQYVILAQLQNSITDARNEINNAQAQSADLVARIVAAMVAREDQLIQAANDAAWNAAQAWMAANSASFPPQGYHSTRFPFIWPAQKGVITQGFGATDFAPEPPGFGAAHFHAGVYVGADAATPILAPHDGVVATATDSMLNGVLIGYGRHVVIAHKNGMFTLYGHLNAYQVKVGQQVHQGDLIGLMGSTGNSSGPHLHFEVRVNNSPIDPMPYLPRPGPSDFRG